MKKTIRRTRRRPMPPSPVDKEAYRQLLEKYSRIKIARMIGVSKQAMTRWEAVPIKYVRLIHEATGISKRKLRPSDFS